MALKAFAYAYQVSLWLGADVDSTRADALLAAASILVRTETGSPWVDADGDLLWEDVDASDELVMLGEQFSAVAVASASRAYLNPEGLTQETTGPFSRSYGSNAAQGVYLTDTEKAAVAKVVRAYRGTPSPGVWSLSTTRGYWYDTETVQEAEYANGAPSAEPFPYIEPPVF